VKEKNTCTDKENSNQTIYTPIYMQPLHHIVEKDHLENFWDRTIFIIFNAKFLMLFKVKEYIFSIHVI